ncbi:MAG: hypothetical protein L0Z55_01860 [Planctomycetes bacterium]|nr:hypothetical protein [Planctomycetota bacterium]
MSYRPVLIATILFVAAGCASRTPEGVFRAATCAFAKGDVGAGVAHFSERMKAARPQHDLEYYYRNATHRRGVEWLADDMAFQLLEQAESTALARVICRGRAPEFVYFVREGAAWKLDLAPPSAVPAQN